MVGVVPLPVGDEEFGTRCNAMYVYIGGTSMNIFGASSPFTLKSFEDEITEIIAQGVVFITAHADGQ